MTTARELSAHLADLLRREHEAMADFLVALADFHRKRVWAELGHANLFSFLHRELGLSNGAAAYRKTAADLVSRYPEVVDALRSGKLCITSIVEVAKVITPETRADVLPRFFGLSKREAAELVAELKPVEAPPRRAVVTALWTAPPAPAAVASADVPPRVEDPAHRGVDAGRLADHLDANSHHEDRVLMSRQESKPATAAPPATAEPLTADLRRYHLTVSKRFLEKLSRARDALSHSKPGATPEEILEAGLDLILTQAAKRSGIVSKPRKTPRPSSTDRVPAHVRREVFLRDGGRCQVPLASGGICGSTYRVQLGHIIARALGGPDTAENTRCECEPHNQRAADRDFGKAFMARFRGKRRGTG